MRWEVRFLGTNGIAMRLIAMSKEDAVDIAVTLLGSGRNVLSVMDATGRAAAIYGCELKSMCARQDDGRFNVAARKALSEERLDV